MGVSVSQPDVVTWHDLECGGYDADLPLWRELAAAAPAGPVLDVGAGTGRVALDLARGGREVIALDRDPELLAELRRRAGGLPVRCVQGDARELRLDEAVALCVVPMQTIQLLGGREGRASFLAAAARSLMPGARLACAITDRLEPFGDGDGQLPAADQVRRGGTLFVSQPTVLRTRGDRVVLERRRERVASDGGRTGELDVIELDVVPRRGLEREGAGLGLSVEPARRIAATSEHVGSTVVIWHA